MAEEKTYIMTEEDKKFIELREKASLELESHDKIPFEELVKRTLEINKISREELERRFDELAAFGFNVREVRKFSCLLPYHIMFSDWTPENYRKDRLDMFAKYGKDIHYIIKLGLCLQEFNTVSDESIEGFLSILEHIEDAKKKIREVAERARKEQEEIEREIEKQKQLADLERRRALVRRTIEKLEREERKQRSEDNTRRIKKLTFISKFRRFLRFFVGHRIANRICLRMMMRDEDFKECVAEGSDDTV